MSKKESLARQSIIINALRKRPMTFDALSEKLDLESEIRGYDYRISKRTFNRDVEEINDLYNIDIKYNYSIKAYCLSEDGIDPTNERLLDAFTTFHVLQVGESMTKNFDIEKRKAAGMEHIFVLMHLVKHQLLTEISYHKFQEDSAEVKTVASLALKEFKNRWYLVAQDQKDGHIKTFGLDRITEVAIGKKQFLPPVGFDLDTMFYNCFGITIPLVEAPERIVLSFDPEQGKYIKSMPLHHSQQEVRNNDTEYRISLYLNITYDLIMELRSYGPRMKVLQPRQLIEELKKGLIETLDLYSD